MSEEKTIVLALDQSTTATGWAIFIDNKLTEYGVYKAKGNLEERIDDMRLWLIDMIKRLGTKDLIVVMEAVQLQNNTSTFNVLSQLQGVMINTVYQFFKDNLSQKLFNCYASEWKSTCGVKGKSRKEQKENAKNFVLSTFKELDGIEEQDTYDAICIGYHYLNNNREKLNFE